MRNFNSAFSHIINYLNISPYLYRYEDKKYIDSFFENGEILISSFYNYTRYEDNELGDKNEGTSMNVADTDCNHTIGTYTTSGMNAYSFCTSTVLDETLFKKFSRNSVFRIKDPINFILELTRSIQRVHQVLHGHCLYVDNRILRKKLPGVSYDDLINKGAGIDLSTINQISRYVDGNDSYFLKERKYQGQSEYRIIWQTDREIRETIIIKCPEAIKYCERIELDEIKSS